MIAIVGCGFLGSLVAEEIGKRWFAFDEDENIMCIDFDHVEKRNAANQGFTLSNEGETKADAVCQRLRAHGVRTDRQVIRVEKNNIEAVLADATFIISAVDNIPTRTMLWYYARKHGIPMLSLGVSQQGTGVIEWTHGEYDTYSLNPLAIMGQREKLESLANVPRELKPCELIGFRGLGLNVAVAAAKAIGIWKGFDPEKVLGADEPLPRSTYTTWDATNTGHSLREVGYREVE